LPKTKEESTKLVFREVKKSNWSDFVDLFESPGCPSYCWCMAWRPLPGDRRLSTNADRKKAMKRIVDGGTPIGILAYDGKQPIAWCSIAPRQTYLSRSLAGEDYPGVPEEKVWSLVCFFVPRKLRRLGIAKQLLNEAVKIAGKHGARIVEAYPVDSDSPSYRFMGFVSKFERAGFIETGRAGKRRHIMHLKLE
jgi:GNAT superfamily N-acetyltransferase